VTRIAVAAPPVTAFCELTGVKLPPARDNSNNIANKLKLTRLINIARKPHSTQRLFQKPPTVLPFAPLRELFL
jgi:hypothetical protein